MKEDSFPFCTHIKKERYMLYLCLKRPLFVHKHVGFLFMVTTKDGPNHGFYHSVNIYMESSTYNKHIILLVAAVTSSALCGKIRAHCLFSVVIAA